MRNISRGLNFEYEKILWYFAWITFSGKIPNLPNPQNGIHTKINILNKLYRELSWSSICLWKQFLIIQISHYKWFEYKRGIVLKLMGLSIKNKKHMSPSTQLSISYLSLFFQVPCDLSIFPWAWRWYARNVICWIPYLLKNTFTEPWNSVPRSLWTLLGGPINLKW